MSRSIGNKMLLADQARLNVFAHKCKCEQYACMYMRSSLKTESFFSQCTRNVIFKNGFSRFVYKNSKIRFNVCTV